MAHARCMLDTEDYGHTLKMCNAYCFSIAKVVAGRRTNVTLYYIAGLVRYGNGLSFLHSSCFITHRSYDFELWVLEKRKN